MRKRTITRFFGIILMTAGLLLILFYGYKWEKGIHASKPIPTKTADAKPAVSAKAAHVVYRHPPKTGEQMGELLIPKLNAALPIYHGTNEDELEKGVGHYAGSVLPGEPDNCVLAGHRDTVFRRLGDVGKGDILIVKTEAGEFTYKVRKVRIVDANDRTVIVPKPKATLTVSTCYPFHYIGAAPKRYVLVANLVKTEKNMRVPPTNKARSA
ncbi:sortase family protein [Anoxybacillus sp. B7M1]|jgi:sortase A|uniref:class D sortase n=1 Tax=unclassified Anoxybacillus TaxID=2639704 RepID=UPI0005CD72BF|nr:MULTISPECIES: class D sortase [unclassified Anoxybacillus]ANB58218.1 sortase family protein [Anoxybacillus sp. B2M1]ANB65330.1 sortase family protein [Anoxybacillus sp. B7M1]